MAAGHSGAGRVGGRGPRVRPHSVSEELYVTVGNGGFGPAYGLLGLPGGAVNEFGQDCVALYSALRQPSTRDPLWRWPERLLPVGHLGCGMFACVDCSTPDGRVIWFEPNPHEDGGSWDDAFIPLAPSLEEWMSKWLAGVDMFEGAWEAQNPAGTG